MQGPSAAPLATLSFHRASKEDTHASQCKVVYRHDAPLCALSCCQQAAVLGRQQHNTLQAAEGVAHMQGCCAGALCHSTLLVFQAGFPALLGPRRSIILSSRVVKPPFEGQQIDCRCACNACMLPRCSPTSTLSLLMLASHSSSLSGCDLAAAAAAAASLPPASAGVATARSSAWAYATARLSRQRSMRSTCAQAKVSLLPS